MVEQLAPQLDRQLNRVFHALSDPTRRALLGTLRRGECSVGELARPHAMSLTAVSKHLRVLEEACLVSRFKCGRQVRCRLEPGPLDDASRWIEHYRDFWGTRMDSLETLLIEEEEADGG